MFFFACTSGCAAGDTSLILQKVMGDDVQNASFLIHTNIG
jgi:hypothetical protein